MLNNETEPITFECLYTKSNERKLSPVKTIAANSDSTNNAIIATTHDTTRQKLMNSVTNQWMSHADTAGINDTIEDFLKWCCICLVRKRKAVTDLPAAAATTAVAAFENPTKYSISYSMGPCSLPMIHFRRSIQNGKNVESQHESKYEPETRSPRQGFRRESPNWDQAVVSGNFNAETYGRSPNRTHPLRTPVFREDHSRRSPERSCPDYAYNHRTESPPKRSPHHNREQYRAESPRRSPSRNRTEHQVDSTPSSREHRIASFRNESKKKSPIQDHLVMQQPTVYNNNNENPAVKPTVNQNHESNNEDSDDSTATRIIEKSELFTASESAKYLPTNQTKSSVVYGNDTITVTRPKVVDSEPRRDLKLTLEIEPFDQITIKTPPKTPERRASDVARHERNIVSQKEQLLNERPATPDFKDYSENRRSSMPSTPVKSSKLPDVSTLIEDTTPNNNKKVSTPPEVPVSPKVQTPPETIETPVPHSTPPTEYKAQSRPLTPQKESSPQKPGTPPTFSAPPKVPTPPERYSISKTYSPENQRFQHQKQQEPFYQQFEANEREVREMEAANLLTMPRKLPIVQPPSPPKQEEPVVVQATKERRSRDLLHPNATRIPRTLPPIKRLQRNPDGEPEQMMSSGGSVHDSYESNTDNEQFKKSKSTRKGKQSSGNQGSSRRKFDDSRYAEKSERPRDLIVNCFVQLQSNNWEEIMDGIENFSELSKKHPELVDANLHLMSIELGKQIRNLRSQVARTACQAAGELFLTHRKTIEPEAEELTSQLLHRTSDTNKFLRSDAIKAIENMCDNLPPSKVIHILCFKGATHHNGLVRCATAQLLSRFVQQVGGQRIFNLSRDTRDKLILTSANLLMEGSLETRNHTKDIFKTLSEGHANYTKIITDVIPPRIYRHIEKVLNNIK